MKGRGPEGFGKGRRGKIRVIRTSLGSLGLGGFFPLEIRGPRDKRTPRKR